MSIKAVHEWSKAHRLAALQRWWQARSLRTVVRVRIAEALTLSACGVAICYWVLVNPKAAQGLALFWAGMVTSRTLIDAWRKWRALHSPLFYLAAVKHDLGGGDDAC